MPTVVAAVSFSTMVGGEEVLVRAGERFASTHPVAKAHGRWFVPEGHDVKRSPSRARSKESAK